MKKEFRDETQSSSILEKLEHLLKKKEQIIIWQQQGNERLIKSTLLEDINDLNDCLFFLFPDDSVPASFNEDKTIYITNRDSTLAFNCNILMIDQKQLITNIPKKILLPENREIERQVLDKAAECKVYLQYGTEKEPRDGHFHIKDISKNGASLYVPKKLTPYIYKDEALNLRWKYQDKFIDIPAKSVHVNQHQNVHFVGLSFVNEITQDQIDHLLNSSTPI